MGDEDMRSTQAPDTGGEPLGNPRTDAPSTARRGIGERLGAATHSAWHSMELRSRATRAKRPWLDRIVAAVERYHRRSVGRQATVVTYVSYFLAFPLLVVYLMVLSWLFRTSRRSNDFVVSLLDLPQGTYLGDIVDTNFNSSLDAFIGLVGVIGVVLAAAATASNLRVAVEMIFGLTTPRRSLLRAPALDFSAGLWLAVVVLVSWLLSLGFLARRGVVNEVVGMRLPGLVVPLVKFGSILVAGAILAGVFDLSIRRLHAHVSTSSRVIGSVTTAAFVVVCNFVFLYFTVALLADPEGGGGFGLALVLLLWVSIVVRGVMYILCWVAVDVDAHLPDGGDADDADLGDGADGDDNGRGLGGRDRTADGEAGTLSG